MDIKIKSKHEFNEILYDKAYGFAKSAIQGNNDRKVRFFDGYAMTASLRPESCVVTIHKR